MACNIYYCHGYFRCRFSQVCVHPRHLCDGLNQCPQHDDERFCDLKCPVGCTCFGLAFFCPQIFPIDEYTSLVFLEGRGSHLTPQDVKHNAKLVHLGLASCGLANMQLPTLNNLRSLDLSDNNLIVFSGHNLSRFTNLHTLTLSGNPLAFDLSVEPVKTSVVSLDLSRVLLHEIHVDMFAVVPDLQVLNLSFGGIHTVLGDGFHVLPQLSVLDLRGCPITQMSHNGLRGLQHLTRVYTDNYKMCCPVTLPDGFSLDYCDAPSDELSSCEDLLRSNLYRILLALVSSLSLFGNFSFFIYRIVSNKTMTTGFGVFVAHLSISDLLMGVYLAVIGVADQLYRGNYVLKEEQWRHSTACQLAGVLSFLSCEVSAFVVCLITLDRFLVLRFPFSQLCFRPMSAHLVSGILWILGLVLASVPLLPATSHWDYYSQTGICIPLPITRNKFPGQEYSFGIMIILNFVLFVLICFGQVVIYWSVQSNAVSCEDINRKRKNQTLARRLFSVALTDFLCWFPIGVLGVMASHGVSVSVEFTVATVVIALPLNSALNPYLYTLNLILERRRLAKEDRLRKMFQRQGDNTMRHGSQNRQMPNNAADAAQLIDYIVEKKILNKDSVRSILNDATVTEEH